MLSLNPNKAFLLAGPYCSVVPEHCYNTVHVNLFQMKGGGMAMGAFSRPVTKCSGVFRNVSESDSSYWRYVEDIWLSSPSTELLLARWIQLHGQTFCPLKLTRAVLRDKRSISVVRLVVVSGDKWSDGRSSIGFPTSSTPPLKVWIQIQRHRRCLKAHENTVKGKRGGCGDTRRA